MHWDERNFLMGGLARLMDTKYGAPGARVLGADSSSEVSVDGGDEDPMGGLRAMGVRVETEGVAE